MPTFDEFRQVLPERLAQTPGVQGLVWAGSSAEPWRADEWSDHDFFVIVDDGLQETFRNRLDWLPSSAEIIIAARETAHGLKVMYRDGFVIECAIFSREELSVAIVNHYELAIGDADLAERLKSIHRPTAAIEWHSLADLIGMFYAHLVIGAGRYARGEKLAGMRQVHSYAIDTLIAACDLAWQPVEAGVGDALDGRRRFERKFPKFAADLHAALESALPLAALKLGDVVAQYFADEIPWVTAANQSLKSRLHRSPDA